MNRARNAAPLHMNLNRVRNMAALQQSRSHWYRLRNFAGDAELYLYNEIGEYGITADDLAAELAHLNASRINVKINSPGGEIFAGVAIYNLLRFHAAKVRVQVDSLAASIASVIAMAGDEIVMAPHSEMMIHDGLGLCVGNAADMEEMAGQLNRESDRIAAIYAERAGGTPLQWRKRMQAESWFSAQEAVDAGLADAVAKPPARAADPDGDDQPLPMARRDQSIFSFFRHPGRAAAPAPIVDRVPAPAAPPPEPAAEVEPEPAPDPGPVLDDWDPAVFKAGMAAAASELGEWDPETFRSAVRGQATDAPAPPEPPRPPEPAPRPEPEPPAAEPEPEPLIDADVFRAAVRLTADNAPAPARPAPEPDSHDPYDATVVTRAIREATK